VLHIRIGDDGIDRFTDCVSLIESVVDSLRRVVAFGAYSQRAPRDGVGQLIQVSASATQGILTVESPLIESRPLALRHLMTAIRYQCWRQELPVSFSLEPPLAVRMAAADDDADRATDFAVINQWGHKQAALLINFNIEIDNALGQAADERIRAWVSFCNSGAFCPDGPFEEMDEEFEPQIDVDVPALGVDWAEWSITVFDVSPEAVGVLVDEIAAFNEGVRCITGVEIG
jgi:hypothetical protein